MCAASWLEQFASWRSRVGAAPLAGGPWVRLAKPLGEPGSVGPWQLSLHHPDGLSVGLASVHKPLGIQADLVPVVFESRGVLSFLLPGMEADLPKYVAVEVTNKDGSIAERVQLEPRDEGMLGELPSLVPGTYEWSYDNGSRLQSGSVNLAGGERTRVTLAAPTDSRVTMRVLLDATSIPEDDLTRWSYYVFDEDNVDHRFMPVPKRVSGAAPGLPDHGIAL